MRHLADRVLAALLPSARAQAACPAPYYQYRCYRQGGSGLYQRRYCSYIGGCLVYCGPWTTIGYCV